MCRSKNSAATDHGNVIEHGCSKLTGGRGTTYQGDDNEHGGGDGPHNVGPHTRAVHEPLEPAHVLLEEGAVLVVEHNLKVALQTPNRQPVSLYMLKQAVRQTHRSRGTLRLVDHAASRDCCIGSSHHLNVHGKQSI